MNTNNVKHMCVIICFALNLCISEHSPAKFFSASLSPTLFLQNFFVEHNLAPWRQCWDRICPTATALQKVRAFELILLETSENLNNMRSSKIIQECNTTILCTWFQKRRSCNNLLSQSNQVLFVHALYRFEPRVRVLSASLSPALFLQNLISWAQLGVLDDIGTEYVPLTHPHKYRGNNKLQYSND